jgi:MoaA/NifB/PqqE/SkfB family radical SAM enzyme
MNEPLLNKILSEARELGISIVLLSGGEPLTYKNIFNILKKYPEIIFVLFTNGTLLDEEYVENFKKYRNIVPVISIEGNRENTDLRRGSGVYENFVKIADKFNRAGIYYGVSLTATKSNLEIILEPVFVKDCIKIGCKLFFYVEYVPFQEGTEDLILSQAERDKLNNLVIEFCKRYPAYFIAFPGNEDKYDGCLAAGRGFIHINSSGDVEPCPFSPFSDTNLNNTSLKDALQSYLLRKIRENEVNLKETSGGCALFQKREWVNSLTQEKTQQ